MSRSQPIPPGLESLALDVWCEVQQEQALLLAELAAAGDDSTHAALLHHELGRIRLADGDDTGAADALLQAYSLRPQFRPTLRLARLLYRWRREFKLVVKLLDAEARATRDPFARASLLRQQARLVWQRLDDLPQARKLLETAYRADATDHATLKLQLLTAAAADDRADMIQALERQLAAINDDRQRAALLSLKATIQLPDDPQESLTLLLAADELAPDDVGLLCQLEQLLQQREQPALIAVLERLANLPEATASWRAEQLARAGWLCRARFNEAERGLDLLRQSLAARPALGTAAEAFDLLLQSGQYAEAVVVGKRYFELDDSAPFRAALACQLADLYRSELQDDESALTWYSHCLKWDPSYQPALEVLGWSLEQRGEIDRLIEVHRAELEKTSDPTAAAQRLWRIAALLERHQRETEAIEAHREALATAPGFLPSISALERLFARHERWSELLQLYDEELSRSPDSERAIHVLDTMASIWCHRLHDPDNALECYRKVLALSPNHLPVIGIAARLCAETRRWHDLVELNDRELELLQDPRHLVDLLQRTGEIWETNLLNLDHAIDYYERALSLDPVYLPALKALGRIYRQKGRWSALIQMHQAEMRATADPKQVIDLLYDIGEIYEEELLDELKAATSYRSILKRAPTEHPAAVSLLRLYEHRTDWRQLAALLASTIANLQAPRSKALRLWQLARLREEKLGQVAEATKDYAHALRLDSTLVPAHAGLSELLLRGEEHLLLAQRLEAALGQSEIDAERFSLALQLADLYERQLGDLPQACQRLEQAAAISATTWGLWSLAELQQRRDDWNALALTWKQLLALLEDERDRGLLQLRLARLQDRVTRRPPERHDPGEAGTPTQLYEPATASQPGVQALAREAHQALAAALQVEALQPHARLLQECLLRLDHRPDEWIALLQARSERSEDPFDQASLFNELAELYHERGALAEAEQAYRAALSSVDGNLWALSGLGLLLEQSERWQERAELAEQQANAMESSRGLASALLDAGELWEDRVGEKRRALPLYQRALKVQPGHPQAFRRLYQLLAEAGRYSELASLVRDQISCISDPEQQAALFADLAHLYLDNLGQQRKGIACLRRVLDLQPNDLPALIRLGDLNFAAGNWLYAQEMYERALELLLDEQELQRISRRLGDIQMQQRQPRAALDAYQRAAAGAAGNDPALLRLIIEAAAAADDARSQVAALQKLAECSLDPDERIHTRKQIAQLAEDLLEDDALAVSALEEALVLDPLDLEAIERLASIHGRANHRSAVSQHLNAAAEHHRAALAQRPFDPLLYRQLGRIFQWERYLDRLYCACVPQLYLGTLEEVEQRFFQEHHDRCRQLPSEPLNRCQYETMVLPQGLAGPLRELLATLSPGIQRLVTQAPAVWGLSRSSRLKANHPLRAICDTMAGSFGGLTFDLFVTKQSQDMIQAMMLSRPAIVVGARIAEAPITAAERFHLGRAMFLLAENALAVKDLSVPQLRQLLVALGRAALPSLPLELTAVKEPEVAALSKQLSEHLGRKERKQLRPLLESSRDQLVAMDLGLFAWALRVGGNRTGLVLCADPRLAVQEAALLQGIDPQGAEIADLLQYLISEEYLNLRPELGLTPRVG